MTTPTAANLLKLLDKRKAQTSIAALGGLDDQAHGALRRALTAVPGGAKIDVPRLMDSVRRDMAERAARRPRPDPFRYQLTLMTTDQLLALRAELKRTGDVVAAVAAVTGPARQRNDRHGRRRS